MAEALETPKSKRSKEKSEKKKKRKHVEDEIEIASPSKKSKSNEHASNGLLSLGPGAIKTDQSQMDTKMDIDSGTPHLSQSQKASTLETPSKKKKKSKSSHLNGANSQTNGTTEHESSAPRLPTKKKPKHNSRELVDESLPPISTSQKSRKTSQDQIEETPPLASATKKSKKRDKKNHPEPPPVPDEKMEGSPVPMDVDLITPEPIYDQDPTPYVKRTLRYILSTAPPFQQTETSKSPFVRQAVQLYLPLSPITLPSPLPGLCAEHLSTLLLKYYSPIQGVILSYAQPRFSTENISDDGTPLAVSVAEYCTPMIWVDVEFLIFQPQRGHEVEGMIVLQSENHIGVQVYNLFSGRIPKTRIPQSWRWHDTDRRAKSKSQRGRLKGGDVNGEEQRTEVLKEVEPESLGYWKDENGKKVEGVIKFWVWDVEIALSGKDAERNLPSIEGTMREEDLRDDEERDQDRIRKEISDGKKRARQGGGV